MKEMSFGAMIRSLRLQNKMTQAALAGKLGITDKAVSKWERDISMPDISLFPKLADTLGVSIDDLLNTCGSEGSPSRLMKIFKMSHDIRTPLNIILGYTNLAMEHYEDKDRLLRYLNNIRVSGEYLKSVFEYLMEIAHLDQDALSDRDLSNAVKPGDRKRLWEQLKTMPTELSTLAGRYNFTGKRILIVEDMALNREIAYEILKQTGAWTDFAEDGLICLEKVKQADGDYYDLILMDIQMPNMDGMEATR